MDEIIEVFCLQGAGLTPVLKSLDVPNNLEFTPDTVASGEPVSAALVMSTKQCQKMRIKSEWWWLKRCNIGNKSYKYGTDLQHLQPHKNCFQTLGGREGTNRTVISRLMQSSNVAPNPTIDTTNRL